MNSFLRLLPHSLLGRIFCLYVASLSLFFVAGLGLFYQYQFSQHIEDERLTAEMMMNVAAQSVADSAIIGDYDTISKTLGHIIAQSEFSLAQFIDTNGGVIRVENQSTPLRAPPAWLVAMVQSRLDDVNHNIAVGGKDYGVMRLSFAVPVVAGELWHLAWLAFLLSLGAMLFGVVLIWVPLNRWLGNFDRIRAREADILSGHTDVRTLLDHDAPKEIRHTFDILSRAAGRLSAQREEAAVTLNAISDGVLTIDAQYCVLYCNPAVEHILGIRACDWVGKDVRSLLPNAIAHEGVQPRSGDVLQGTQVRRLEFAGTRMHSVMLDTTMSTIHLGSQGAVLGYVLALRDVTQQHALDLQLRKELQVRQRALDSLHHVMDSFQSLAATPASLLPVDDLDALTTRVVALMNERELGRRALDNQKFALDQHAIVSITDLQGVITYANDRFCEISGYSRDELLGVNHRIVKSGVHAPEIFVDMWQTIERGHVWRGELCNRSKQGAHYWVHTTLVPLLDKLGRPEQYIAIRTDITARVNFETQLEDQLHFVEVLLDATPTAIYLKDLSGRYLRFNKAFEELFGIDREQWLGKNVFDLVAGPTAQWMHAKDQELLSTGSLQTYVASFTNRKTAQVHEGLYWKAPLTNSEGQITAVVGTILDVTEKNRLERELLEATRNAQAANKAKSDFLANMSHEIRTPMNGVIGMTDLALEGATDATQRGYLSTVKSSAQSLMVILNDILDFSKIEAGKLTIESVEFALLPAVAEILKPITARAEQKGLRLEYQCIEPLPATVRADPGRIRQVLTNLCDNAIKFTAQGHVRVVLQCIARAEDGTCDMQWSVQDTGIGIPADKQQGIFEAFNQADTSTTRQFGGTGLGLTICARLVDLMGGRIWVESVPGAGSTFHFTLRLQEVSLSDDTPVQGPGALHTQEHTLQQRPLHVLLVEDHPINQLLATTVLKKWGHTVVLAHNGQEAVDLFPSAHWDLVLMDMQMPVMGGLEATRLIRAAQAPGAHTPIMAMTANAMESDRQACLAAGMDDHLPKPFSAEALQALIQKHVGAPAG